MDRDQEYSRYCENGFSLLYLDFVHKIQDRKDTTEPLNYLLYTTLVEEYM